MRARAEAAAATGERILDAAVAVFWQQPVDDIPLEEVARRAGVSVQTVIRRFGGKQGLLAAAAQREAERVRGQRDRRPSATCKGRCATCWTTTRSSACRCCACSRRRTAPRRCTRSPTKGRAYHADWCERVFAPTLAGLRGARRTRRLALLVAVTDVLTWKLLRHDRQLSRRQTELALIELLRPLTGGG